MLFMLCVPYVCSLLFSTYDQWLKHLYVCSILYDSFPQNKTFSFPRMKYIIKKDKTKKIPLDN